MHSTAARLPISEVMKRKPLRALYADKDDNNNPFLIRTPVDWLRLRLPNWFRSFKGLLAFALICFFLVFGTLSRWKSYSATQAARWEAQLAERALSDPEFEQTPEAAAKWAVPWPTLSRTDKQPRLTTPAPKHAYNDNGLLMVDVTNARHPILDLIEKGERDWHVLKTKQSKNLNDVISEYKRRYKRYPPKGFDSWWKFTQNNGILLPDEYDQIDRDLLPFRSLDPVELRHRSKAMQERGHTFTLIVHDGVVDIEGPFAHIRRAKDIADIIKRFAKDLPLPVNMTFIMDDSPAVLLQHESKSKMIEMASSGEQFGPSDYTEEDAPLAISNFARACPPNSLLRLQELNQSIPKHDATQKSFIWNSDKANDVCNHPEFKRLHGHTQTRGTEVTPLVPLFVWAKMRTHSDILVTPLEQYWDSYIGDDPDWSKKSEAKLLWRGSTTGADFTVNAPWKDSQRARLHFMSRESNNTKQVMWADVNGRAQLTDFDVGKMNEKYMDTSFSGSPAQCDPETCEYMRKNMDFAGLQGLDDSYQYKYMIDVDGNAWSGRFHRLMSTKSLVLKSTVFPEWYADRLIPWYHYIPVKVDYSDLYDIMAFFAGTIDGQGAHDRIANRIAENGRYWAGRYWRRVDMTSYMYRLVLEWSRLLHQGNEDVDFIPRPSQ